MRLDSLLRSFTWAPWPQLFATSVFGLILCAYGAGQAELPSFCSTTKGFAAATRWPFALDAMLALRPPLRLLADWGVMLLAMMPPLLAMPLLHVWHSSLPRRRVRAVAGFLVGYGAVWFAAGPLLIVLALLLHLVAGGGALAGALALAMLWSASPWHQAALNRGHRLRRVGLFGGAADRDCLVFGTTHAMWCFAACWAWMLVPLVGGAWHLAIMLLAGALMLVERLAPPSTPRWRWPAVLPRPRVRAVPVAAQSVVGRHD